MSIQDKPKIDQVKEDIEKTKIDIKNCLEEIRRLFIELEILQAKDR